MAIDLSTFWATWDVVGGNTEATNQYEFWNGMVMANGDVLANQYEFFTYHNTTRYEWFKDLQGTYPEVYDEYTFYKNTSDVRIYDMRTFYQYGAQYLVPSVTPTPTPSNTPPVTPTLTPTPTNTITPSVTANPTPTPTVTPTKTANPTPTPTVTPNPTNTPTNTNTPTPSPSPTGDTDATIYLAAVVASGGTVNSTITAAVNTLFTSLKATGLYSKLDILMPMVGGVKNSILINAKSPSGSWGWTEFGTPLTYNVSGITTNSNGALRSNWTFGSLVQSRIGNSHFSMYCNRPPVTNNSFNGMLITSPATTRFATGFYANDTYFGQWQTGVGFGGVSTQVKGLWTSNTLLINTLQFYENATIRADVGDSNGSSITSQYMAIGTLYWPGQGYTNNLYPSDLYTGTFATLTIGSGMSSSQMIDLNSIITTFNTTLNRA